MIDVSCFTGPGPLVRPGIDLTGLLRGVGITTACASPAAGLFRSDPAVNDDVPDDPLFRPVPIVDPQWTDLGARLRAYRTRGCRAVRILPASHGYPAADARELKRECGRLGLVLILQMRVADLRNLPPGLDIGEVAVADAATLAAAAPDVPMVVSGARAPELRQLLPGTSVLADLSMAEEPDVLRRAVATHGAHRILTGTHAPFLTPAAARYKLDAARLTAAEHDAVTTGNARKLGMIE